MTLNELIKQAAPAQTATTKDTPVDKIPDPVAPPPLEGWTPPKTTVRPATGLTADDIPDGIKDKESWVRTAVNMTYPDPEKPRELPPVPVQNAPAVRSQQTAQKPAQVQQPKQPAPMAVPAPEWVAEQQRKQNIDKMTSQVDEYFSKPNSMLNWDKFNNDMTNQWGDLWTTHTGDGIAVPMQQQFQQRAQAEQNQRDAAMRNYAYQATQREKAIAQHQQAMQDAAQRQADVAQYNEQQQREKQENQQISKAVNEAGKQQAELQQQFQADMDAFREELGILHPNPEQWQEFDQMMTQKYGTMWTGNPDQFGANSMRASMISDMQNLETENMQLIDNYVREVESSYQELAENGMIDPEAGLTPEFMQYFQPAFDEEYGEGALNRVFLILEADENYRRANGTWDLDGQQAGGTGQPEPGMNGTGEGTGNGTDGAGAGGGNGGPGLNPPPGSGLWNWMQENPTASAALAALLVGGLAVGLGGGGKRDSSLGLILALLLGAGTFFGTKMMLTPDEKDKKIKEIASATGNAAANPQSVSTQGQ